MCIRDRCQTPFGNPSDKILSGEIFGVRVLFLARHGRHHSILPSEVNYKANIWALKSLGAEWCIGIGAVGSLKQELAPGHIVVPDQSIDFTKKRSSSFFGEGIVAHVSMAEPFCPSLRKILIDSARNVLPKEIIHIGGSYVCIEGPQFSTKAESEIFRKLGASIIGMTNMPEAKLAREAEIAYSCLNLVTDYDCWHETEEIVDVSTVMKVLKDNAEKANKILVNVIQVIKNARPSVIAQDSLKNAIVTDLAMIPKSVKQSLGPILSRYLK